LADTIILLLVEDEALILHTLEDVLTDAGFKVVTAIDGAEAIVALDNKDHALAGLITDIRIGDGINGWDVARHARELAPSFPVVYMSGDSVADWPAHGVPNSAILQKPFASAQMVTAISHLLNEVAKGVTE
jgi:DNA-binding response OmpR family regulator